MLRIPAMRLRLFPLLLIPLIALWKINDLSRPDGISKLIGDREEPAGRRLFASEEHQNTVFTVENVNYKWTTIHANILEEETGRYMEVLSFLEDLTYDGPMSIHHQVIVPPNIAELVEEVTCKFHGTGIRTKATMRYEMPHAWYAVLLRCGVPDAVQLPANSTVEVSLRKGHPAMHHTLQLRPYAVEEPSITPNVAFCLSPVFGKLDIFKILEWRLHHARIGVKTVHWYSREANPALKSLVNVLNHNEGLKDTWKDAVPLSPDTFQTERLQEHGLYGDQVLYYIDCLERSKHLHPTHWLAFLDLDEFFLPEPFELSGMDNFLDHPKHHDVGSICIDRNQAEPTSSRENDPALLFEELTHLVERKEDHPTDNRKCLHRPGSLLVPFVHWPLLVREGQPSREVVYRDEGSYLRLLHASHKAYWGSKIPLARTEQYERHVQQLRRSANYYVRTYAELFQ